MMFSRPESVVSSHISLFDGHGRSTISLPPTASPKGHQCSRTTVDLPPLFSRSKSLSPTRSPAVSPVGRKSRDPSPHKQELSSPTNNDSPTAETQRKVKTGTVGKITSWFEGSSEPVNITIVPNSSPKPQSNEPFYQLDQIDETAEIPSPIMDNLTQRPRKPNLGASTSANSSRFSFFKKPATNNVKSDPDELIQLDIREALLPDGPINELTPAAFKNLQLSAESLLRRFQISYAENIGALRQLTSQKNVQADELDAAQTRNEHLKMQLLEMAEKASDQERVIASLKSQLANPPPDATSSVRMITDNDHYTSRMHVRRNRISDVSASDESFVDSEMSSALSIFSDVDSIRTPATSVAPSPVMKHASLYSPMITQGSPMQAQVTPVLVPKCQKCHNVPANEAWDVIEMMKMESTCLKERIAELETAQDSALDFLTTLKL